MVCASSRNSRGRGRSAWPFGQKLKEGDRPGLPLPQKKGVHKGGQGLGVQEGGHPAGQDQGVSGAARRGQQRNPGPLQDLQDIRVIGLKGDGEGQGGEVRQGPLRLQGEDGGAGALVLPPILRAGEKGALAVEAYGVVEQPVNGLKAQVAHGHRVDLGVDQGHGPAGPPVPHHCASFLGQDFLQAGFDLGGHGSELSQAWKWWAVPTLLD